MMNKLSQFLQKNGKASMFTTKKNMADPSKQADGIFKDKADEGDKD